ncbi:hypothetical protein EVAR_37132_1 [Eumeta japonica]|uniref:Uncharacterized protein n=1 Tax=Eumeta variegata TaxID=151549 RepID=A0A4C1XRU7_EUMVA|nr:hypothetical protein EVAR_37132_1 [Eumeta japonica]
MVYGRAVYYERLHRLLDTFNIQPFTANQGGDITTPYETTKTPSDWGVCESRRGQGHGDGLRDDHIVLGGVDAVLRVRAHGAVRHAGPGRNQQTCKEKLFLTTRVQTHNYFYNVVPICLDSQSRMEYKHSIFICSPNENVTKTSGGACPQISPGAGVIPALIAKSSICYDPLIYVGMNTQFRQSIKRFFGIHRKGASQTEKGYDNTLMSPVPRHSRVNDTQRQPHSETRELSVLREHKLSLEVKNSGETHVHEDRGDRGPEVPRDDERSSVLDMINNDTSAFMKRPREGTEAGVDGPHDVLSNEGFPNRKSGRPASKTGMNVIKSKIKHSHSLDLSATPKECGKRKLSVENGADGGSFSKINILRKIFTSSNLNRGDGFETFLCEESHDDSGDQM